MAAKRENTGPLALELSPQGVTLDELTREILIAASKRVEKLESGAEVAVNITFTEAQKPFQEALFSRLLDLQKEYRVGLQQQVGLTVYVFERA